MQQPKRSTATARDNENWLRDDFQFPRLIAEILATQSLNMRELAESMDLSEHRVHELFDRAQSAWERIKEETT